MKKIYYDLKIVYDYSLFDMTISFNIKGNFIYRKNTYEIITRKTHGGPIFVFEYFTVVNDNLERILYSVSPELIKMINYDLRDYPDIEGVYIGEIEISDE